MAETLREMVIKLENTRKQIAELIGHQTQALLEDKEEEAEQLQLHIDKLEKHIKILEHAIQRIHVQVDKLHNSNTTNPTPSPIESTPITEEETEDEIRIQHRNEDRRRIIQDKSSLNNVTEEETIIRGKIPSNLPRFRGKGTNAIEDPQEFLDQFVRVCRAHDEPEEYFVYILPMCLDNIDNKWLDREVQSYGGFQNAV